MELSQVAVIVQSLVSVLLLGLTYSYLEKLEKIGCVCAEHPYRKFIKTFTLVAIVYLLVTMVFPPDVIGRSGFAGVFAVISAVFAFTFIVYLVMAIMYVRYLQKEKCKCSEDLRREILYFVSILELLILFTTVIILFLAGVASSAVLLTLNTVKGAKSYENAVISTVRDPVEAVKKFPGKLGKLPKEFKKNISLKKR